MGNLDIAYHIQKKSRMDNQRAEVCDLMERQNLVTSFKDQAQVVEYLPSKCKDMELNPSLHTHTH